MKIHKDTPLSEILKIGKQCTRKNNCCKYGSGFLIGDDIKRIAKFLGITEEELKNNYLEEAELFNTRLFRPKIRRVKNRPYGPCVFFDGTGCTIHKVKPLQCRVGTCGKYGEEVSIWFMLNYLVNRDDPESIRQYALYLKNGGKTIEGGKLEDLVPNKERLRKILSMEIL